MSKISKLDRNLIIRKIDSKTINIQITNNTMLMSIVGQFDQNLKELEKINIHISSLHVQLDSVMNLSNLMNNGLDII